MLTCSNKYCEPTLIRGDFISCLTRDILTCDGLFSRQKATIRQELVCSEKYSR